MLLFGLDPDRDRRAQSHEYGPAVRGSRPAPIPVFAAASETEPTAFVRVLLLPREWEGKRTIRYVDPADEEKPKLQRADASTSTGRSS